MTDKNIDNLITALQEIHVLVSEQYEADPKKVGDFIEDLLITGYVMGRQASEDYLDFVLDTKPDFEQLHKALNLKIEGKTYRDRVDEYVENGGSVAEIIRVAETDFHRMYNTGLIDGGNEIGYHTGQNINKTWVTAGDDKVRDTHEYLEGMTVPLNEEFYTFDGDHSEFPGGFEKASNNCNCRCVCILS